MYRSFINRTALGEDMGMSHRRLEMLGYDANLTRREEGSLRGNRLNCREILHKVWQCYWGGLEPQSEASHLSQK